MKKFLLSTYDFFQGRKILFYTLTILLFTVLGIIASRIKIEEDISRILPNGKQAEKINQLLKQSKYADKIVVKVKTTKEDSPEDLTAVADSLKNYLLQNAGNRIDEIKITVDDDNALDIYKAVHRNVPFYLTEEDFRIIDSLITPENIAKQTESNYNTITSASGIVLKKLIADDPIGMTTLALRKLQTLQIDETYELYDGYMLTKDRKSLFFFIKPKFSSNETSENEKLIDALDDGIAKCHSSKTINVLYYGGPPVGVSNALQLKKDTILTLSITVVALLVFTIFFFRKKRVPVVMMLPVIFGGLFSLAIITIVNGSISSIAIGAGSIVLGIAINYSIHFFGHYKHCGSVKQTIADLLQPMTIGSFTTVGSFFALMLLQSQILNDFGLFAGLSLTGAAIFALLFLPHFVSENEKKEEIIREPNRLEKILSVQIKHSGIIFIAIIALTFFFFKQAKKVGFDSDMNHFSFMNEKLKASAEELDVMQDENSKTIYIASEGKTLIEALDRNEVLLSEFEKGTQSGFLSKYSSINSFIPSPKMQQVKWKQWKEFWSDEKKQKLIALLKTEGAKFKFRPEAFQHFSDLLNKDFEPLSEEDISLFKNSIGSELIFSENGNSVVMNAVKVNKASREKFYSTLEKTGAVILDKQIITNSFVEILYSDFNHILLYTALLVFISLLISYGSLELTAITFLPMLITWIWILGIMGLCGLQFNLINIIISTFIFGLGDDFSIFTTDGLTKKFAERKETLTSHKVSIFLCAATTVLGLGALIFAKHPALKSIAFISIIGIFCVLFIGQIVQPVLYNFFIQSRKEKKFPPWTFITLILFWIAFGYYVFVCLLATFVGYVLLYLVPYPGIKKRKMFFHYLVCGALKVLTYMMVNVRKTHEGKSNMDFSKPAIIIANHASFLDILVTVMQHPKLILLTNKWVYYSPVFGKVVQLADYYPVMEGVEPGVEKFVDIVKDGYSIVIFPEGTRSKDGRLNRFHKGAFYLAEQLNLDIVPMLLHGTGDCIRKGDFMVMNANMTMKFLPRIASTDKNFGEGYATRSKIISRHFKAEFEKLREEKETPFYFRQKLRMNYLYKGPEVLWHALKQSFASEKFSELNKQLPRKGKVATLGCSYGYSTFMISLLSDYRTVTGFDSDETKTDIARNGYLKNERINFVCADVFQFDFEKQDAYVVSESIFNAESERKKFFALLKTKLNEGGKIIVWNNGVTEILQ